MITKLIKVVKVKAHNPRTGTLRPSIFGPSAATLLLLAAVACAGDDRFGDPLPEGAVAHCGTVRFRFVINGAGAVPVVSPDGRLIALSPGEGQIHIWDARTGKVVRRWDAGGPVSQLSFSPNGKRLVAQMENALTFWDPATGQLTWNLVFKGVGLRFRHFAISPDGTRMASTDGQNNLALWDVVGRRQLSSVREIDVRLPDHIAFGPDAKTIVTLSEDEVCEWDPTGARVRHVPTAVRSQGNARLAPGGRLFAVIADDRKAVVLGSTSTGKVVRKVQSPGTPVRVLAFSPDDQTLAAAWITSVGDVEIGIIDTAAGRVRHRFPVAPQTAYSAQFTADGRALFTVGNEPLPRLWDVATGKQLNSLPAHEGAIRTLAFTPDGRLLISGSADTTVRGWNPATGELLWARPGHRDGVNCVAVLLDGRSLLSCGVDDRVLLTDLATGRELRRFDLGLGPEAAVTIVPHQVITVAVSPDGGTVCAYSHSDGQDHAAYHAWDAATGRPRHRDGFPRQPTFLAFAPDAGHVLEYIAPRGAREPWSPRTQLVLRDLAGLRPLLTITPPDEPEFVQAFAPDGQALVSVTTRQVPKSENESDIVPTLRVWELATGQQRLAFDTAADRDFSPVERLAITADGRAIAVARANKHVEVYDLLTGRRLWRRGGFDAGVAVLAFSPNGQRLATGHTDSTILVWDVAAARPAATDRPLTAAERDECWAALAGDAAAAGSAMARLAASPTAVVSLFRERLRPAEAVPADRVRALIADLADPRFAVRDAASKALAGLGEPAEPHLTAALAKATTAEQRQRIERLLAPPRVLKSPEALRRLRAIQVLGWLGTPAAHAELRRMSAGDPADRATKAARDAVRRASSR